MEKPFLGCLFLMLLLIAPIQAQEPSVDQTALPGQEKVTVQAAQTALSAYNKWRDDTLPNFLPGLNAQHYAVAFIAQRLDEQSVQLEYALAAQLNHYTLEVRPLKLLASSKGEVTLSYLGKPLLIEPAGDRNLPARFRVGSETMVLYVGQEAEALEITWTPIHGNDKLANTCVIPLRREPTVFVNGYVHGLPVR